MPIKGLKLTRPSVLEPCSLTPVFERADMKHQEAISLRQLAEMLGINQSQARKYVLKLGYSPPRARTPDSRGKLTYVFKKEEAEQIVAARRQQGFIMGDTRGTPMSTEDVGVFYIIQLVPELPQTVSNSVSLRMFRNASHNIVLLGD